MRFRPHIALCAFALASSVTSSAHAGHLEHAVDVLRRSGLEAARRFLREGPPVLVVESATPDVAFAGTAATRPHDIAIAAHRSAGDSGRVHVKVLDASTGEIRDEVRSEATGRPAGPPARPRGREPEWRKRHGALSAALHDALATRAPDESTSAVVIVDTAAPERLVFEPGDDVERARADHIAAARTATRDRVDAVVDGLLAEGVTVDGFTYYPPRVQVTATAAALRGRVARLEGVRGIYPRIERQLAGTVAAADMAEDGLFLPHILGAGQDLRIAIVEPRACVYDSHDDFQFVSFEATAGLGGRCTNASAHATAVAGAVAAARMVAGEWAFAGLFAGRMFESEFFSSAVARNPDFVNMSTLHATFDAFDIDSAVYFDRIFVAAGAGNDAPATCDPDHLAVCHSYNALCVGGYAFGGSVGDFGDDHHAGGRWCNQPTGREEPDVAGLYSQSLPTQGTTSQYGSWGGTSFATPSVVGLAALLTASFPSALRGDPTLLRAVLKASATHTVSDFPGDTGPIPLFNDGVDDRTGAGVPRGDRAAEILDDGHYVSRWMERDVDFATGAFTTSFHAYEGQTVRVVASWDQCPVDMLVDEDPLRTDLDLKVTSPPYERKLKAYSKLASPTVSSSTSKLSLAASPLLAVFYPITLLTRSVYVNASVVDNYELVQFKALATGTYSVELRSARWDRCATDGNTGTYVAIAWDAFFP